MVSLWLVSAIFGQAHMDIKVVHRLLRSAHYNIGQSPNYLEDLSASFPVRYVEKDFSTTNHFTTQP